MGEPVDRRGGSASRVLRALAVLIALGLFAWVLAHSDLPGAWAILRGRGPLLALAVVPFGAVMLCETLAWRATLAPEVRPPLRDLLAVRVATEAVLLSVPGGGLVAEALKPSLLQARAKVSISATSASVAATKALQPATQGLYVLVASLAGASFLARAELPFARGAALVAIAIGVGLLLVLVGAMVALSLTHGTVGARLHAFFSRLPIPRLRAWLSPRAESFGEVDATLRVFFGDRRRILGASAWFFAAWIFESVDAWVILRLLGAHLSLVEVASFEAIVSVVRALVVVVPAGLGVQDASYVGFLRAFAVPGAAPLGGAFVLVKRAKELVWIAFGYALLAFSRRRR